MMKSGRSFILVVAVLLAIGVVAEVQTAKVYRIGMLVSGSPSTHGRRVDAFRQGLRELGYIGT